METERSNAAVFSTRVQSGSRAGGMRAAIPFLPHRVLLLQRQIGNAATRALFVQRRTELHRGDLSHEVGVLQQKLNVAGATPRLVVDAEFGAGTSTALVRFKRSHRLPGTAVADDPTWAALDTAAPDGATVNGETVVPTGQPGRPVGRNLDGIHPKIENGATGFAVNELHEKLNAAQSAGLPVAPDRVAVMAIAFDATTEASVKQFQRSKRLIQDGIVGDKTWAALDTAAPGATMGSVDFIAEQQVRGERIRRRAHVNFQWSLEPNRTAPTLLRIRVGYNFVAPDPAARASIPAILSGITTVWNKFAAQETLPQPGQSARKVNIEMDPVVDTTSPHAITLNMGRGQTNASEYFLGNGDDLTVVAAHEFGHHMGLADEYQQTAADHVRETGHAENIGAVTGDAPPTDIARELHRAMRDSDVSQRGQKAVDVVQGHNLTQGAFAQQVGTRYRSIAGARVGEDAERLIPQDPSEGVMTKRRRVTHPFYYTEDNLMGGGDTMTFAPGHTHDVAPRHVAHLVDIVQAGVGGNWQASSR